MLKVYAYECEWCDNTDDLLVEEDDKEYQSCEVCGAMMDRLPATPMVLFKHNDTKLKR